MAATVAMALEPAVRQDAQSEAAAEEQPSRHHEAEEIGAALALVSVAKESVRDNASLSVAKTEARGSDAQGEDHVPVVDAMESDKAAPGNVEKETVVTDQLKEEKPEVAATEDGVTSTVADTTCPPAVAGAIAIAMPEGKASRPPTPTSVKSKKAENALGIPTSKKKKQKKKKPEAMHPCVGLYIDALDKNRNWGNARIMEVDETNEKIKITFPGFSKNWDLWTDVLSIAPHGSECVPPKGLNSKSWDGLANLFTGERLAGADPIANADVKIKQELKVTAIQPQRVKKGYKLEIIPDTEVEQPAVKSAQSSKRKLPAARESPTVIKDEPPVQVTAPAPKRSRVVKITPGPSPKTAASPMNAPLTDPELARQRNENSAAMDQSATFLSRCVDVWKKQFFGMTESQRSALLSDETPAYVDL